MAKNRYIDTRFWHDTFIRDHLNPLDRYLFLYFLTNDKTNICGVYELPLSIIANETGIEIEMIKKMLKRLKGKIDYIDGWIVIHNFIKYQNFNSPKIQRGIQIEVGKLPEKLKNQIPYPYGMDTISHSNSNTNKNNNSNTTTNERPSFNPTTSFEWKSILSSWRRSGNKVVGEKKLIIKKDGTRWLLDQQGEWTPYNPLKK